MMPSRTNHALSFFPVALVPIIFTLITNKIGQLLLTVIFVFLILFNTKDSSTISYFDYARYQYDRRVAADIASRINLLVNSDRPFPVFFSGKLTYQPPSLRLKFDSLLYSFFEMDGGNNSRIAALFRLEGYHLNLVPAADYGQAEILAASLPDYPASGSVALINDTIIIKLSDDRQY
jgi:hypothetical protein